MVQWLVWFLVVFVQLAAVGTLQLHVSKVLLGIHPGLAMLVFLSSNQKSVVWFLSFALVLGYLEGAMLSAPLGLYELSYLLLALALLLASPKHVQNVLTFGLLVIVVQWLSQWLVVLLQYGQLIDGARTAMWPKAHTLLQLPSAALWASLELPMLQKIQRLLTKRSGQDLLWR